jgi:hypothetical protein
MLSMGAVAFATLLGWKRMELAGIVGFLAAVVGLSLTTGSKTCPARRRTGPGQQSALLAFRVSSAAEAGELVRWTGFAF